jgi:hypothetical protein
MNNGGKHNRTNLWRVHVAHMSYTSEQLGVEGLGVAPGYITRARYDELRIAYPGILIAWRVGDFYEFYGDDAVTTSQVLGITLTGRQLGDADRIEMTGVPYHSVERYLATLISAGKRVALCEPTAVNG